MEPITIQSLDSFSALRKLAPCLETSHAGIDIFHTIEWFETLAGSGMDRDARLHLLLASDPNNGTCFCLPLVKAGTLTSLSNYYSSLYGPISSVSAVPLEVWRAVCRNIRVGRSRWPILDLQPLDAGSPFCRDMLTALKAEGYLADTYFRFGNWYLDVGGRTFDGYFSDLPSRLRNTIERGRRKLSKEAPWNLEIHRHPGKALDAAIADFDKVYRLSWKQPESHPEFIGNLCRMAAERGWLRLGIIRLRDEAVAAQIWLTKDRKACIYKLAYSQAHGRFSVGSILTAELMRHAMDVDRVEEVDYLTGDDAYKRDWMSHRRERVGIVAFDPATMRGLWAAARHFAAKTARHLKNIYRRHPLQCEPLPSSVT